MDKSNETPTTGAHNLTTITTTSQELLLENIHTLRITERIQIESEIADILREETISAIIHRYKH